MLSRVMRFRCAGYGPNITTTDRWKSLGVMLGGTLLLTLVWLWGQRRFDGNPYIEALSVMAFMVPLLISLRYTSLKGRRASVQAVFITAVILILTAILLGAAWLGARL